MITLILSGIKYISIFLIVLFLFSLAEKQYNIADMRHQNKNRILHYPSISRDRFLGNLFVFLAILVLCLFAGMRADTVGADTSGYPIKFMKAACSSHSYFDFINTSPDLANEYLGSALVYICSRITNDSWLLLFSYQLFTVWPVFLASYLYRKELSITTSMAIYLFVFFNNSLNMMRQSMSCAFILLGTILLIRERKICKSAVLSFASALLFHRSGVYGIILVLAVFLGTKIGKKVARIIIYISIFLAPTILPLVCQIIVENGLVKDTHALYYIQVFMYGTIERDWYVNPLSIYSITYILVCSVLVILPFVLESNIFNKKILVRSKYKVGEFDSLLRTINIVGFLIYITLLFSFKTMYGIRFSIYFDFFYILSIPHVITGNNKKIKKRILYVFLFFIWSIWIMKMGWSGSELYNLRF